MTKIFIRKQDLMYQIDIQSKGRDVPETMILEGSDPEPKQYLSSMEIDYPRSRHIFTRTEFDIMCILYEQNNRCVQWHSLYHALNASFRERSVSGTGLRNTVSVHIKNLRRKIVKNVLPIRIQTNRGMGFTLNNV